MLKWYIHFVDFYKKIKNKKCIQNRSYFVALIMNNSQVEMEFKMSTLQHKTPFSNEYICCQRFKYMFLSSISTHFVYVAIGGIARIYCNIYICVGNMHENVLQGSNQYLATLIYVAILNKLYAFVFIIKFFNVKTFLH